jgi:hypothetical protein
VGIKEKGPGHLATHPVIDYEFSPLVGIGQQERYGATYTHHETQALAPWYLNAFEDPIIKYGMSVSIPDVVAALGVNSSESTKVDLSRTFGHRLIQTEAKFGSQVRLGQGLPSGVFVHCPNLLPICEPRLLQRYLHEAKYVR